MKRWLAAGFAAVALLGAGVGHAQDAALAEAVAAVEAGEAARAVALLDPLVADDPAYVGAAGAAAFWLGQAYTDLDQPEDAAAAWARGWAALRAREQIDLRLADAFLLDVFARRDSARYAAAADAYLLLLGLMDRPLPLDLEDLRARHLAPLALILPEDERQATGLTDEDAADERLPGGAGERLVTWWRSMDNLPATPAHERLHEHLERVAHALREYPDEEAAGGFDDRGAVYIRLGLPERISRLRFADEEASAEAVFEHRSFPENEFWVYRDLHNNAQYLFVQPRPGDGFRLSQPADLIPRSLYTPKNTRLLLQLLTKIYRRLALANDRGHYGLFYDRLAGYVDRLETNEFKAPLTGNDITDTGSLEHPQTFLQRTIGQARSADQRAARIRDEEVPAFYSNLLDDYETLPVDLRVARFLDDDGTTRTELYWALPASALRPSRRLLRRLEDEGYQASDAYVLGFHAVPQSPENRPRARQAKDYFLHAPKDKTGADDVVPPQRFAVQGDEGAYRLALQWDLFWARFQEGTDALIEQGPRLKLAVFRLDTLRALRNEASVLEMSDLVPLRLTDADLDAAPPYPHAVITPEIDLALHFEIYHLTFGADDQTHYRVEYEVTSAEGGGLLRRRRDRRSAAGLAYTGTTRTADERLALDLSDWEGTGDLTITVRVTDETSGQAVARSLTFTRQP